MRIFSPMQVVCKACCVLLLVKLLSVFGKNRECAGRDCSPPRSRLGWKTPSGFVITCNPRRDLALRYAEGSAPAPVATTAAQPGKSNSQGELRTG